MFAGTIKLITPLAPRGGVWFLDYSFDIILPRVEGLGGVRPQKPLARAAQTNVRSRGRAAAGS